MNLLVRKLASIFRFWGRKYDILKFLDMAYGIDKYLLKLKNVTIGENTLLLDCKFSSSSKGDKFTIGSNTTCTGVVFLAHDASPSLFLESLVLRDKVYYPASRLSYRKEIKVGNNCFIGYGAILLPGIVICDNCVIAAGSIVSKSIHDSGVYGGNPAKKISSLKDYINKYENIYKNEPECF